MKDIEVHKGLKYSELRDVLAKLISDAAARIESPEYNNNLPQWDTNIDYCRQQIKYHESLIEKYETYKAVQLIAMEYNWEEFDISEFVEKTGRRWRSFFGTKTEFDKFCKDNEFEI